jgi:hypothetical protein
MAERMADDGSLFSPILIRHKENAFGVHLIRMFEDVEFFELFVVKAKLLNKLRVAENKERTIADIG